MARIENHQYTIQEAFQECFYIVPDYQREYVWTDEEVRELLVDIGEQIDTGSSGDYFIGTVLVSPTEQKNHYEVIDGQQRLTTFFLLLCALKNRFRGEPQRTTISSLVSTSYTDSAGEIQTSLKLAPRYEHAGEVMARLVALDAEPPIVRAGIRAAGIPSFGSLERLLNAYATLSQYLAGNYGDIARLKQFWGYLANNVVFIQISTDVSNALKIFETINERGVGLNPMDLLKNLIFSKVEQSKFTALKEEWKKITKPLEQGREKPLRFLRYFLMANYAIRNARGDAVVREDEIYKWFNDKNNATLCGCAEKPFEFVRKVIRNVEHYVAFADGRGNDGRPNLAMESLRRLTGGAFSLHYVLLLAVAGFPRALFDHFVGQIECFLFFYIFTKTPTKDLERNFSQWADEVREIAGYEDGMKQKAALNAFVAERFEKNMAAKAQELSDALRRLSLYSMQQYRTRYLLAKLTQHVDLAFSGLKSPGSLEPYMGLEIEHILPDTPTAELRAQWDAENPGADYEDYKTRLGNLTLLEKPINIVASNGYYAEKRAEYRKSSNYLTRSLAELSEVGQNTSINRINAKLASFSEWDAASIEQRHGLLVGLALDVWKTTRVDV